MELSNSLKTASEWPTLPTTSLNRSWPETFWSEVMWQLPTFRVFRQSILSSDWFPLIRIDIQGCQYGWTGWANFLGIMKLMMRDARCWQCELKNILCKTFGMADALRRNHFTANELNEILNTLKTIIVFFDLLWNKINLICIYLILTNSFGASVSPNKWL